MYVIDCCDKSKNLENFDRIFVLKTYTDAHFLTRALEIK